ncbi:MAG TPA: alpha-glucuronidase family glycosyl hydrolase [Terracidiphilus sp.]|jgi:alpha-glucuronidase|nr:alpha-glucuronidase family glycosyl hydrolase [Terracidiphilus sp.]
MENRSAVLRKKIDFVAGILVAAMLSPGFAYSAQTADQAWLRYEGFHGRTKVPQTVRALGSSALEQSAVRELKRGIFGLGRLSSTIEASAVDGETVVGTVGEFRNAFPGLAIPEHLAPQGFWLSSTVWHGHTLLVVAGANEHGALFGAFDLLRRLATGKDLVHLNVSEQPAMPIRWVDQWDNPDGTITRGYGGRSIFFEGGNVRADLGPVGEYARLLASVGINGCDINNVNAAPELLDAEHLKQIAGIADAMRPWGVRVAMSVALVSPEKLGGLKTADPLDPTVKAWWAAKVNEIYKLIPDFAGFTVKADSEGEVGPASYGRNPADAANLLANALEPHGGVVLYRAFVYDNHLDYNDLKADRARAAYDIFQPIDGGFAPNVIVQTKEGPIDFQAREPVSPLFAGFRKTDQAMEVQITQEYTGQQRHLVYLAPMWKEVLDFDLRAESRSTPVKEILEGKSFNRPLGGMVGVACVGREWLGSPMAMANLYAFGRLAWDPGLTPEQIAAEWTRQTIGNDPAIVSTLTDMLMQSWPAYEHYTGPLGTQTLTGITGSHYGPNIEASERNGWGQWHRDDAQGIGMDRTVATGTGYAGQYPPEVAKIYESLDTTPDNLLLFFHHVSYTYKLHSGQSVIQYFYDSHYQGAAEAAKLEDEWITLKGKIDPALFEDERARLEYQAGHAIVWRDAIVQYFLKRSGIPDDQGRAGHFPGRFEAEDARLTGYKVIDVTPWEDASGGKAVSCNQSSAQPICSAEWTYAGPAGRFNIAIQYFDLQGGAAKFSFDVNGKAVGSWTGDATFPSRVPNGDNSTRIIVREVELKPGNTLLAEGTPDGDDPAALDYIEIEPATSASF